MSPVIVQGLKSDLKHEVNHPGTQKASLPHPSIMLMKPKRAIVIKQFKFSLIIALLELSNLGTLMHF